MARTRTAASPVEAPRLERMPGPAFSPCTWVMLGRSCRMPGTVTGQRALCTWHLVMSTSSARRADDFDEFERWVLSLLDAKYCCLWTHYPARALWNAVQGRPALAEPPAPQACAVVSCGFRGETDTASRPVAEHLEGLRRAIVPGVEQPLAELVPAWVTEP